jgi:NADH:ubiquinone oxidoreductase subunit K
VTLNNFLILGAFLFCTGLYGVLARKNAVLVLMSIELMLNAVNINLVAFWRYVTPAKNMDLAGQVFALFVVTLAAAEAAIGLALIIAIYRARDTVNIEDVDLMKW